MLYINEDSTDCILQQTIINELQNKTKSEDFNNQDMKKTMIKNRQLRLLAEANTDQELDILDKSVRPVEVTFQTHKSLKESQIAQSFESNEPPSRRRKFEPQRKFKSTKKARQKMTSSIVVPTTKEKQDIAINLIYDGNKNIENESEKQTK